MRRLMTAVVAALALAAGAPAQARPIPPAVTTDPTPDATHPTQNVQVLIPSGGVAMNAVFMLASGAGSHPTLVLLHGLPGNEQNLDLAQAVRRAGWNVLTFHYRGSWGSPGSFSLAHVLEDADAAMAFVRQPAVAAKYGIDTNKLVIGGHSMGGWASAMHAAHDPNLAGVVLLDSMDAADAGARLKAVPSEQLAGVAASRFDDLGSSLGAITPVDIANELIAQGAGWSVLDRVQQFGRTPMLVIGSQRAGGAYNHALAQAVAKAGGKVTNLTLQTDHSFSDHRIELAAVVVGWLDALPK